MHIIFTSRTLETLFLLAVIGALIIWFAPLGAAQWIAGKLR